MIPAEDMEVADVCEELDEAILQLFDALEMLQTKREAFNSLVEQGWFSLSKARYAMGNKSVSTLQYGHQMSPLVQATISERKTGQVEFLVVTDVPSKKDEHEATVEEIGPSEPGLRRRKAPAKSEDPLQPLNADSPPAERSGHQDPLTWFGILVPQSLRQAQKTFREGIYLAAEIASLQSEIDTIRRRYYGLLERKHNSVVREKQNCS